MSMLFIDSFDHYVDLDEKWDTQFFGNNILATQVAGRFTPGALQVKGTGGNGFRTKNLKSSTELIAGFAYNNIDSDVHLGITSFTDNLGGDAVLTVDTITGVGVLTYNGQTATTASAVFTGAVWQFIEMRVRAGTTTGELEIRRNGVQVALTVGVDTLPGGFTGFEAFKVTADNNSQLHYMDDLYILNAEGVAPHNTFLGDTRITVLRPKANGNNNNFTPTGAASNFQAVDETIHDSDTTFVEAGQIGAKEDYNNFDFSDLGIVPGTIFAVQTVNAAKKTDAGRLDYLDQMIIGGVTFDNGTDVIATSGAYKMTTFVSGTDPSDSAAWTESKVTAVGSGFEITFREV